MKISAMRLKFKEAYVSLNYTEFKTLLEALQKFDERIEKYIDSSKEEEYEKLGFYHMHTQDNGMGKKPDLIFYVNLDEK